MAGPTTPRPKLKDVARIAGVGTATVDRVLNERGNVSEEVRRKVIETARAIGLRRQLPPSYKPLIRINLILARPELPLLTRMAVEFRNLAKSIDRRVSLHITTLPDEAAETVAAALRVTDCDAVVVYAPNHIVIRDAIDDLHARGIPVVSIISDLSGSKQLAYAGTNHHAAGRTTGFFVAQMSPQAGPVVVLCSHLGFQPHAERIAGFREYLLEHAPHLTIARIVEGLDDRVRSRARLEAAFRELPQVLAIYNVGGANLGVRAAIEANILAKRPLFVGHELTEHTTRMLREGLMTLTLDQNPRLQAQFSLDVLMDHFGYQGRPVARPYTSNVPIVLYGPENIPPTD
ncbi:LacI family DNA-binding transcriptional regulator [Puniceibacterium sp. IMCC21224]|uniref:LacI family DNA-binding transcriptional regulator n=1 Tax=Puniceibacterium sp. IMCC21224 TaxID=1618204 RepID=UPI0018CEBF91|nr:LacI family DNA-binding transcriptional regulator [Puniceibacterium sp. IMCC21224]